MQIILYPFSTVENIYESLKMLPHLPEIIEQKLVEFSNLSEDEQCRALIIGLVSAGFYALGSSVKAAVSKNLNLAMGKFAKTAVVRKVVEGCIKLTGKAKDKIRSLVEHKDVKCRDLLKMRGGHNSATKQGNVCEWWDKPLGEVANAAS